MSKGDAVPKFDGHTPDQVGCRFKGKIENAPVLQWGDEVLVISKCVVGDVQHPKRADDAMERLHVLSVVGAFVVDTGDDARLAADLFARAKHESERKAEQNKGHDHLFDGTGEPTDSARSDAGTVTDLDSKRKGRGAKKSAGKRAAAKKSAGKTVPALPVAAIDASSIADGDEFDDTTKQQKGRRVKVVKIDGEYVTVEVVKDADATKRSGDRSQVGSKIRFRADRFIGDKAVFKRVTGG